LLEINEGSDVRKNALKMKSQPPVVIAISGFSSNVGKTTLVCELLRRLPGWEAIKLTRGHYRSCGRDPAGCCVSDLLRDEPVIRSGRAANYQVGKDTGYFWDAGASNVHWVIVQDNQVERGIKEALTLVETDGVVIEGNSLLDYIAPDLAVMCARANGGKVKSSARQALKRSDVLYLSSLDADGIDARKQFELWRAGLTIDLNFNGMPVLTSEDLPQLVSQVYRWQQRVKPDAASIAAVVPLRA
jgi:molybdopterin-guanine dinucleotide biosynthesis protein